MVSQRAFVDLSDDLSPLASTPGERPVAILQMGQPPDDLVRVFGAQPDWVAQALADGATPLHVVRPFAGEPLPSPSTLAGAVLTGSWSMVTDREPWSELTAQWVREAMTLGLPLLGICYGHQLMAHALGGTVDFHPEGREIGQQVIELTPEAAGDPLLAGLPRTFLANLTHEQSVLVPPAGAVVLARSRHDAHQILRYGPHALSVQFHPEFSTELMSASLARRAALFAAEGFDVPAMRASLVLTEHARHVLRAFIGSLSDR